MKTATINFKSNIEDKKRFEIFADAVGISISSLLNSFIKKTIQEQRIPFEISINEEQKLREIKNEKFNQVLIKWEKDAKKFRKFMGYEEKDELKAIEDAVKFRKTGKI